MWFDNHCHLTSLKQEPELAVAAAREAGVTRLLTVGCSVADSIEAIEIASRFPDVWATAGVHPHDAKDGIDGLDELLADETVVAVGECGLDYHYDNSPRQEQAESFVRQIALAHKHELALVIHTREAWDDTFEILDREGMPERTVFHCFTGGADEATAAVERGAYVSLSGIVTFKTAENLREAAAVTPLDRILVETDSPYLAPVPHRGKPNQPANVAVVGEFLAELLHHPVEEFAAATTANANTLFGLV
ncbi:MAG: TatD family hydrolase [Acidimicrobiales bacterium]